MKGATEIKFIVMVCAEKVCQTARGVSLLQYHRWPPGGKLGTGRTGRTGRTGGTGGTQICIPPVPVSQRTNGLPVSALTHFEPLEGDGPAYRRCPTPTLTVPASTYVSLAGAGPAHSHSILPSREKAGPQCILVQPANSENVYTLAVSDMLTLLSPKTKNFFVR